MTVSSIDKKQRKRVFKILQKKIIKETHGFAKVSYYISKLLIVLAIVVGCISLYYTSIREHYTFEYLIPLAFFGAIYGISFMVSAIYKGFALGTIKKEYQLPLNATDEKLSYDGKSFVYSYGDDLIGDSADTSRFIFSKDDIRKIEYDEETRVITLHGNIIEERYKGDRLVLTNEWEKLTIINTFKGLDLYEELR